MAQFTLTASIREKKGKEAARRLRRNGQIPAVFYGPGTEPLMLTVDDSALKKIIKRATSDNIVLDLEIDTNGKKEKKAVILKELQVEPRKDLYLHADFYEISMDKEISVEVPVHFVGTAAGVAAGGIMQQIRRELTISCLPNNLIDRLEVNISHLEIGDSIHVEDIEFPEGIKTTMESHLTVAVVAAPTVTAEKEEEEEIEGEVEVEEEAPEAETPKGE